MAPAYGGAREKQQRGIRRARHTVPVTDLAEPARLVWPTPVVRESFLAGELANSWMWL
jgi:hypothetical protein